MANELKLAIDDIKSKAEALSTIRKGYRGQPVLGISVTPCVAVFADGGGAVPETFSNVGESHNIILRFYWSLKGDPEEVEEDVEEMWHLVLAKYYGDWDLSGTVTYSDVPTYRTGYQEIPSGSNVNYRVLDVTISFYISAAQTMTQ